MITNRDPFPVATFGGLECPKCAEFMQRYKHSKKWQPQPHRGHYTYWDRCEPCGHIQHYADAYVTRQSKDDLSKPQTLFDPQPSSNPRS